MFPLVGKVFISSNKQKQVFLWVDNCFLDVLEKTFLFIFIFFFWEEDGRGEGATEGNSGE